VPSDNKRESGWVRLDLARTLKRWQTVELPLMLGFAYSWRDEEWSSRSWQESEQAFRSDVRQQYTNAHELILALRPSWRIKPWVSIETEFGLRFTWSNVDNTEVASRPEWEEDRVRYQQSHDKAFRSHGWYTGSSLGMLSLLFWF
jgi:hypothetical protein